MTGSSTSLWTGLPAWWRSPNRRSRAARGRAGRVRRRGGFTLLEVLIAFTILAVALVALLRAFSSGLRGLDAAEAGTAALQHARSKIEEVGTVIPLEAGEHGGEFEDGTRWSIAIRPYEAGEGAVVENVALVPYEIEVTVSRERGGKVTLRSLRLAPRQ